MYIPYRPYIDPYPPSKPSTNPTIVPETMERSTLIVVILSETLTNKAE